MPKRGETVVRSEEEEEEEEEKVDEVAGGSEGGARVKDTNKERDTSDTDTRPRNTRGRADEESGRVTGESRERGSWGGRRARFGDGEEGSRSSQRRQAGEGFGSLQEGDRFHARNHSSQFQDRKQFRPHPSRMKDNFQQQEHRHGQRQ